MTPRKPAIIQEAAGAPGLPAGYGAFLDDIKVRIRAAQTKAALSVNRELISLYWYIGKSIVERQLKDGWGKAVVDRLAADLQRAFPGVAGFSPRNVWRMRAFHLAWTKKAAHRTPARTPQISDTGRVRIGRPKSATTRGGNPLGPEYRSLSEAKRPPPPTLVCQDDRFAFVGRQVHLEVDGEDSYMDLLFYHLRLRCYMVIELKAGGFKPEYAGKINFCLSAVDDRLRHPQDKPSIGLILCRSQKRLTAEYALRDLRKPIGIARWQTKLVESLPKQFKGQLPSIEDLEAALGTR